MDIKRDIVMSQHNFVLVYPSGDYVSVDKNSGGYPYPVGNVLIATHFEEMEARAYQQTFLKENFKLFKVLSVDLERY